MTAALSLFVFTIRQTIGERRLLLVLLLLLSPAGFALLIRSVGGDAMLSQDTASSQDHEPRLWQVYQGLMLFMLLGGALPMAAMLYGPASITSESESGTLVYLFIRRLRRYQVLLVRFVALTVVLALLGMLAALAVHAVLLTGIEQATIAHFWGQITPGAELRAYLAVMPWAAAGFLAVFGVISLITNKALVVSGLYLVFVELIASNVPVGVRAYSISHLLRRSLAGTIPQVRALFGPMNNELIEELYPPGGSGAVALVGVVVTLLLVAAVLTTRRELSARRVARD